MVNRSSNVTSSQVLLILSLTVAFAIGYNIVHMFLCGPGGYIRLYAILGIATQIPLLFFNGRGVRLWVFAASLIVFGLIIYDYTSGKRLRACPKSRS
jgi:hypothetical protein